MVTINDAKEVAAEIVNVFIPLLVTLFGSVARKRMGHDLDLLVVFDDTHYHGTKTESQLQVSLAIFHRKFDIEPFTLPTSNYHVLLQSGEPFL